VRALIALVFLAPAPPLLFMGEEWAASTPFLFFCDFEPELAAAVTAGRRREFEAFAAFADPQVRDTIPDPSAPATFAASTLRWDERHAPVHAAMLDYVTSVLHARNASVVPVAAALRGTAATAERVGEVGLALRWQLHDGLLHADAQLGPEAASGFDERLTGETFFATHGAVYADGTAPGWSVRWART